MSKLKKEMGNHVYILSGVLIVLVLAFLVWCGMPPANQTDTDDLAKTSTAKINIEEDGKGGAQFVETKDEIITEVSALPTAGLVSQGAMWATQGNELMYTAVDANQKVITSCKITLNDNNKVNKIELNMPFNMGIDEGAWLLCRFTNHSSDIVHNRILKQIAVSGRSFVMQNVVLTYDVNKKDERIMATIYPVSQAQQKELSSDFISLQYEDTTK